mmetsp:Transcript_28030/g.96922  ORF Transcript_28030/g.96922 Transcript_28030/m.96922 type:complete len:1105 (-) Transcript_28030:162-3476(-)
MANGVFTTSNSQERGARAGTARPRVSSADRRARRTMAHARGPPSSRWRRASAATTAVAAALCFLLLATVSARTPSTRTAEPTLEPHLLRSLRSTVVVTVNDTCKAVSSPGQLGACAATVDDDSYCIDVDYAIEDASSSLSDVLAYPFFVAFACFVYGLLGCLTNGWEGWGKDADPEINPVWFLIYGTVFAVMVAIVWMILMAVAAVLVAFLFGVALALVLFCLACGTSMCVRRGGVGKDGARENLILSWSLVSVSWSRRVLVSGDAVDNGSVLPDAIVHALKLDGAKDGVVKIVAVKHVESGVEVTFASSQEAERFSSDGELVIREHTLQVTRLPASGAAHRPKVLFTLRRIDDDADGNRRYEDQTGREVTAADVISMTSLLAPGSIVFTPDTPGSGTATPTAGKGKSSLSPRDAGGRRGDGDSSRAGSGPGARRESSARSRSGSGPAAGSGAVAKAGGRVVADSGSFRAPGGVSPASTTTSGPGDGSATTVTTSNPLMVVGSRPAGHDAAAAPSAASAVNDNGATIGFDSAEKSSGRVPACRRRAGVAASDVAWLVGRAIGSTATVLLQFGADLFLVSASISIALPDLDLDLPPMLLDFANALGSGMASLLELLLEVMGPIRGVMGGLVGLVHGIRNWTCPGATREVMAVMCVSAAALAVGVHLFDVQGSFSAILHEYKPPGRSVAAKAVGAWQGFLNKVMRYMLQTGLTLLAVAASSLTWSSCAADNHIEANCGMFDMLVVAHAAILLVVGLAAGMAAHLAIVTIGNRRSRFAITGAIFDMWAACGKARRQLQGSLPCCKSKPEVPPSQPSGSAGSAADSESASGTPPARGAAAAAAAASTPTSSSVTDTETAATERSSSAAVAVSVETPAGRSKGSHPGAAPADAAADGKGPGPGDGAADLDDVVVDDSDEDDARLERLAMRGGSCARCCRRFKPEAEEDTVMEPLTTTLMLCLGVWTPKAAHHFAVRHRAQTYCPRADPVPMVAALAKQTASDVTLFWQVLPGGIILTKAAEYLNEEIVFTSADAGLEVRSVVGDARAKRAAWVRWAMHVVNLMNLLIASFAVDARGGVVAAVVVLQVLHAVFVVVNEVVDIDTSLMARA